MSDLGDLHDILRDVLDVLGRIDAKLECLAAIDSTLDRIDSSVSAIELSTGPEEVLGRIDAKLERLVAIDSTLDRIDSNVSSIDSSVSSIESNTASQDADLDS